MLVSFDQILERIFLTCLVFGGFKGAKGYNSWDGGVEGKWLIFSVIFLSFSECVSETYPKKVLEQKQEYDVIRYNYLGGDFKHFLFSPLFGEMIQFDEHIFQMGWFNHQLVN